MLRESLTRHALDEVIEPLPLVHVPARHLVQAPPPPVVALPLPHVLRRHRDTTSS